MIPVERVTELLNEHRKRNIPMEGQVWRVCGRGCDWESNAPNADEAHATHQARVLADAGLIPTQREWGVEYRAWTGAIYTEPAPLDEAERIVANDDQANLMTRWSGATAWTAEEEQG